MEDAKLIGHGITHNIKRYIYEKKDIKLACILPDSIDSKIEYDILAERFIYQLRLSFLERECGSKEIEYEFQAPTFGDWFFRKKRKFKVLIKGFDVIASQPFTPTSQRHVEILVSE